MTPPSTKSEREWPAVVLYRPTGAAFPKSIARKPVDLGNRRFCRYLPQQHVEGLVSALERIEVLLGENRQAAAEQVAHRAPAAIKEASDHA